MPAMKGYLPKKMISWDDYFFGFADNAAKKSHCLSRQLGAVAVRNGRFIVATGYNGPPAGYPHCERMCPRKKVGYQSGQGLEICPSTHAELNVLIEAARLGISLVGCSLYLTGPSPCRECAKAIVNAGIKEVVYKGDILYPDVGLTGEKILKTCGVKLRQAGRKGRSNSAS
jgi:dCMP deaminase